MSLSRSVLYNFFLSMQCSVLAHIVRDLGASQELCFSHGSPGVLRCMEYPIPLKAGPGHVHGRNGGKVKREALLV